MANREQTAGLMKIGELAKAAGVSVSTVKFYAKEGLIRAAVKTGRNMAYYDPACVETIQRIRKLQRERFYPLSVIKGLLENGGAEKAEFDLLDAIHKSGGEAGAPIPLGDAAKAAGLTAAQAAELVRAGLIDTCGTGRRQAVSPSGQAVMALVGRRLEAGIPFAIMTDHPVIPEHYIAVEAAICAREGLPEIEALKAITINAAEILGLDGRFGSLTPGKDADIALYDGHPLDARSHVTHTLVNGEVVFER